MIPCESQLCVSSQHQLTYRNPRTRLDLVSNVNAECMRKQPLTRATDVVFDMKNDYRLDISYRVAWLGIEKGRGEVYGDHAMSFNQLRWYNNAVTEHNPQNGFKHCRQLLFLDSTFLNRRFKGNLFTATTKDGNQGIAILQQVLEVVDGTRMLTFIFDRNVGLLQSMPFVFPSAHHAFCLLHLQMNLRDRMKFVNT
ncbi:hypothetical protein HYC85_028896 [Camellia sinensis]|uniref:MULE transposase domain-containing protein n=1 Tax=Camellia sinensis TaxID=4442 RepID=A0A7J7FWJ5_CAMSI|nr:hypothetical protein HYC85_028896 [Camellia sinensis]